MVGHATQQNGDSDRHKLMAALKQRLRLFRREEDGVMLVFSIMMLMTILLIGGIGVDLMRHEMMRTRLQATIDRAVLAAADLDQPLSPAAVVNDYFAKAGMSDFLTDVQVNEGLNFRNVYATAEVEMDTTLMHLAGIRTLTAPASGAAEERIGNVEISMVVDISGSMRDNNRLTNLQNAARVFIDTVLKVDTADQVSISFVPYSEQVNIGQPLYNMLNKTHRHNYSHCLEVPAAHFTSAQINQSYVYAQTQHFQWNYDGVNNTRTDTICPRYSYETITPFSRNATTLKNQVNALRPRAGTSIYLGMKWGVGLLDPQSSNLVTNLISQGRVENVFAGRPAAYSDPETLKTVVLMTDGENSSSSRINPSYYQTSSHYTHWDNNNLWWYLYRHVSTNQRNNWWYQYQTPAQGDIWLGQICTAAKNAGIVVWGIGFEVTNHGANVMRDCSSSPSHFFRVEGIEIRDAFQAIARQINQLRLTQ